MMARGLFDPVKQCSTGDGITVAVNRVRIYRYTSKYPTETELSCSATNVLCLAEFLRREFFETHYSQLQPTTAPTNNIRVCPWTMGFPSLCLPVILGYTCALGFLARGWRGKNLTSRNPVNLVEGKPSVASLSKANGFYGYV